MVFLRTRRSSRRTERQGQKLTLSNIRWSDAHTLFRIREESIYRSLPMSSAQRKHKTLPRHVKNLACGGEALANFIDPERLTYMQGTWSNTSVKDRVGFLG